MQSETKVHRTTVQMGMAGLAGAGMTAFLVLCVVEFVAVFAVGAIYPTESCSASYQWLVTMQDTV